MIGNDGLLHFLFLLIFVSLIIIYRLLEKNKSLSSLRKIAAFDKVAHAIGLSVEAGKRIHLSLGNGLISSENASSGFIGLSVLKKIIRVASKSDRPPVVVSGDATLSILSQCSIQAAGQELSIQPQTEIPANWLVGLTPYSFAAGSLPVIYDEQTSVDILLGYFGSEIGLILDASERSGNISLAGSDQLNAQAIVYAAAQEPLIGEELYAAGAYVQTGGMHQASLHAEDVLRWIIVGIALGGAILKMIGIL
jgi:hypothetical protein